MFKTLTTLAAATLALAAAQAQTLPTRVVGFGDLDLASPAGQAALEARIRSAVKAVCGTPNPSDPRELGSTRNCRRDVAYQARQNAERAIARYEAKSAERLAARK